MIVSVLFLSLWWLYLLHHLFFLFVVALHISDGQDEANASLLTARKRKGKGKQASKVCIYYQGFGLATKILAHLSVIVTRPSVVLSSQRNLSTTSTFQLWWIKHPSHPFVMTIIKKYSTLNSHCWLSHDYVLIIEKPWVIAFVNITTFIILTILLW